MPCLYLSTNLNLDEVDTDPIFSEATKAVASIIGKPENVNSSLCSRYSLYSYIQYLLLLQSIRFLCFLFCFLLSFSIFQTTYNFTSMFIFSYGKLPYYLDGCCVNISYADILYVGVGISQKRKRAYDPVLG